MRALRIIFIIILLGAFAAGAYFIYRAFFAIPPAVPTETPRSQTGAIAASSLITALSQQEIFDYWINRKTNALYLVTLEGKIIRTFGDGRDQEISAQTLPGLHRVEASLDGARALAHFNYPTADTIALFDTETRSWERLPEGVFAATFDPAGNTIAYLRRTNGRTALATLTLANKKVVELTAFAVSDGTLRWVGNNILVVPPPSQNIRTPLLIYNIATKTASLADAGAMSLSDSASGYGLRFRAANSEPATLSFSNALLTIEFDKLPFLTIPGKCSFTERILYCAVPQQFPPSAALPDDYLKEKLLTADAIFSFNTDTGKTAMLFAPDENAAPIDATRLVMKGKQLLFKNRYDEKLYAVELEGKK